jgi:GNAT superfamily N-acetyltransferase
LSSAWAAGRGLGTITWLEALRSILSSGSRMKPASGMTFLRELAGDLAQVWREEQGKGVWRAIRTRTLDRVFQRLVMLVIEQDLAVQADVPLPPGVEITLFPERESEHPVRAGGWSCLAPIATAYRRRVFRERHERGRICFVAWRDGQPVGYSWVSPRLETSMERFDLPLPADAAYGWDLYVAPRERRSGVGSALVSVRMAHAQSLGFRRIWRVIAVGNRASLRTAQKTWGEGSRVLGTAIYLRILGRARTRFRLSPEPGGLLSSLTHSTRALPR